MKKLSSDCFEGFAIGMNIPQREVAHDDSATTNSRPMLVQILCGMTPSLETSWVEFDQPDVLHQLCLPGLLRWGSISRRGKSSFSDAPRGLPHVHPCQQLHSTSSKRLSSSILDGRCVHTLTRKHYHRITYCLGGLIFFIVLSSSHWYSVSR